MLNCWRFRFRVKAALQVLHQLYPVEQWDRKRLQALFDLNILIQKPALPRNRQRFLKRGNTANVPSERMVELIDIFQGSIINTSLHPIVERKIKTGKTSLRVPRLVFWRTSSHRGGGTIY